MRSLLHHRRQRRGVIAVLTAVLLVVLMTFVAFSVDIGFMYSAQTLMDRSVDAAALAGTAVLIDGEYAAEDEIVGYLVRNPIEAQMAIETEDQLSALKTEWCEDYRDDLQLTYGYWNTETRQLEAAAEPSAVRVAFGRADVPLYFARVLGQDQVTIRSSATATYRPRDIMIVLDLSASMNDDSELKSIPSLGREAVERNLGDIYYELGSPQYGDMTFDPQYATAVGVGGSVPLITVEYRGSSVYITSSQDISNVVLELADGTTVRDESFQDGDLTATMTAGQVINRVWVKSANNAQFFGHPNGYGELFDFTDNNTFVSALGLTDVPYPYPSGSWSSYIDYVKSAGTANSNAGYQFKFGYLNLVNYWLERQPAYSQTPDLWKVGARPLATVKDAVQMFIDHVRDINIKDRVGLAIYNSASGEGAVEVPLTDDLDQVVNVAWARQAGHYHGSTNIGGGMSVAEDELQQNGREGTFKMVIVLTDGVANWCNGTHDPVAARDHAVSQATRAHDLKYKVMTISLGLGADITLMQELADIGDGVHFNVPGGRSVEEMSTDLMEAFAEIARKRPVMLVE